jgi:KDO2-lipid IV(A) lauroyltransferase
MKRRSASLSDRIIYWLVMGVFTLLGLIPSRIAYGFVAALGRLYFHLSRRRQQIALHNLRQAFGPGRSDRELLALGCVATGNILRTVIDMAKLRQSGADAWQGRVDSRSYLETVRPLHGKPFIAVTPHLGSWELAVSVLADSGFKLHVIARRLDNPLLDHWLIGFRESHGLTILPRRGGIKQVVAALRRGEVVGALLDQNQRKRGIFIPVFGKLASTDRAIASFAARWNLPVLVASAVRVGKGFQFVGDCEPLLEPELTGDRDRDTVALAVRIQQGMERLILRHPEQYFWIHDRYKTRPPEETAAAPAAG